MKRRAFTAPPTDERCKQDIKLRDGSGAQCMRRAVVAGMCRQHAAMARDKFCAYCGGNDETPPDHTQDCTRPRGVLVDAPSLSDERFCELWKQARDGTPDGMCGHVQVRQFGKLLYAELGITSPGPWPLGWEPKDGVEGRKP